MSEEALHKKISVSVEGVFDNTNNIIDANGKIKIGDDEKDISIHEGKIVFKKQDAIKDPSSTKDSSVIDLINGNGNLSSSDAKHESPDIEKTLQMVSLKIVMKIILPVHHKILKFHLIVMVFKIQFQHLKNNQKSYLH
jgi:hypothetical protein